jgi:RHS repeat-associated protein
VRPKEGQEFPKLRQQNSRTVAGRNGILRAEIYPAPINFKDGDGNWQPINPKLVTDSAGWHSAANDVDLSLPADLSDGPVSVSKTSGSISMQLHGAKGPGKSSGQRVSYDDALPGVDVRYDSGNDRVKETLTLSGPEAAQTLQFDVAIDPNSNLEPTPAGGLNVTDKDGTVRFSLLPAFMDDAAGAHSDAVAMTTTGRGGHYTVTVAPDAAWLTSPSRAWPVVVDPTITFTGSTVPDCYMASATPTTSQCGQTVMKVGYDGVSAKYRSLVTFPVNNGSIPFGAQIMDATVGTTVTSATTATTVTGSAHQVTKAWTSAVTWNTYNGSTAWTTAGGDYTNQQWTGTAYPGGFYFTLRPSLVRGWLDGSIANNGLLLRTTEAVNNVVSLATWESAFSSQWPSLEVDYQMPSGLLPYYTTIDKTLTDRSALSVNMTSGNLNVRSADMFVKGTGLDLNMGRSYNSLTDTFDYNLGLGANWQFDAGSSYHIEGINYDPLNGAILVGPSGYRLYFDWDGAKYVTPPGLDATLTYNSGTDTFTLVINQTKETLTFPYSNGLDWYALTTDVDRNGADNKITNSYDSFGDWTGLTDSQGRTMTLTNYGTTGMTGSISMTTSLGTRTYTYAFDASNRLQTVTDPSSQQVTYGYDTSDNLNKITDATGHITTMAYDAAHRITTLTQVTNNTLLTGPTTTFAYGVTVPAACASPAGLHANTMTDPNSHTWTYCYNSNGQVIYTINALGNKTQKAYNSNFQVTQLTDSLSAVKNLTFDATTQVLKSIVSPPTAGGQTGATSTLHYPTSGLVYQPDATIDAQNNCRGIKYDAVGNATDAYDGQTPASGTCGVTTGTRTSVKYQGGTYNAVAVPSCTANGLTTTHKGIVCATVDGKGNTTTYGHDNNGNLTTITPPAPLGVRTVVTDALSRIVSITDGRAGAAQTKTTACYDTYDRVTKLFYTTPATTVACSTSTPDITYVYDADGNLTSRSDNTGTTTFTYDTLNRVTNKALPDTTTACSGSNPLGISYSYDNANNLMTQCEASGTVTYSYNNANQLTGIAQPGGSCTPTVVSPCTTVTNDTEGRPLVTTFPGGATLTRTYFPSGAIKTIIGKNSGGATTLSSFSYTYNNTTTDRDLVQTVNQNDAVLANITTTYTYDKFDQLTDATPSTGTVLHYRYDLAGNRCRADTTACAGGTDPYQYNAANELTSLSGSAYGYDGNGNMTTAPSSGAISYNAKNQATSISYGGGAMSSIAYADADQTERTSYSVNGFATSQFSNALGLGIDRSGGSVTYYIRDNVGNVIGQTTGGTRWYYLKDGLGSVVALINDSGATIGNRYGYDPYGKSTFTFGSPTVTSPYRFAAGYLDASTGLYKFGIRYYDPNLGRFTQTDPTGQDAHYLYAGNSPTNYVDPSGAGFCLLGHNPNGSCRGAPRYGPADPIGCVASFGLEGAAIAGFVLSIPADVATVGLATPATVVAGGSAVAGVPATAWACRN